MTEKGLLATDFGNMNLSGMQLSIYAQVAMAKAEEMPKIKEEQIELNNAETLGLKRTVRKKTTAARKPATKKPAAGIVIREQSAVTPQPAPSQKRTRNLILSHNEDDEDDDDGVPIGTILKKQKVSSDVPTRRRQPSRKAKSSVTSEVIIHSNDPVQLAVDVLIFSFESRIDVSIAPTVSVNPPPILVDVYIPTLPSP